MNKGNDILEFSVLKKYRFCNCFQFLPIFLVVVLLNLCSIINAQNFDYLGNNLIDNFDSQLYGASSQNWAAIQDNRGVMYFGNTQGIIEFDGTNWRYIESPNRSIVRALAVDNQGTVFVGAYSDFGYLAADSTGNLLYQSLISLLDSSEHNFNDIQKILIADSGVYFLTLRKIFYFHNNTIETISVRLSSRFGNTVNNRNYVFLDGGGIGELIENKIVILPETEKFTPESYKRILLLPHPNCQFIIVTQNEGLFCYNNQSDTKLSSFGNDSFVQDYILKNELYTAIILPDSSYMIGTFQGGIISIDKNGSFRRIINKNRALQSNSIFDLFLDRQANVWVCMNNGISMLQTSSPITVFNDNNNLESSIYSVCAHKNNLYAGSGLGLYYLPKYKPELQNDALKFKPIAGFSESCWDFCLFDTTLLTTGSFGIAEIRDTSAYVFEIPELMTYCIQSSPDIPNLLFVGLVNGLIILELERNKKGDISVKNRTRIAGFKYPVRKIFINNKKELWLNTSHNGLFRLRFYNSLNDYRIEPYGVSENLKQTGQILPFAIDNNLYICVNEVYKFNKKKQIFEIDSTFLKNLPENIIIYKALKIEDSLYVMQTNLGIAYYSTADNKFDLRSLSSLKPSSVFNIETDRAKHLWVCSNKGLYFIKPNSLNKKLTEPYNTLIRKVVFESNSIFNGTFFDENSSKSGFFSITNCKQAKQLIPEFEYKNSTISFEFSAAFFQNSTENQYAYYLEGFDDNWSEYSSQTKKEYTNLHFGNYVFHLKSRNIFYNEGQSASFSFSIKPPWYRKWWAYCMYFIFSILILYLIIRFYTWRLKNRNAKLGQMVNERTSQLSRALEDLRQQKEEILTQAEQLAITNNELAKLSMVVKKTNNAVVIMDSEGNFEWVNDAFITIFNMSLSDLKRRSLNIIGKNTPESQKEIITKCIRTKTPVQYETLISDYNNIPVWVQTTLSPVLDDDGNIINLIAIDANITQLKEAEQEISNQKEILELQNEQILEHRYELAVQKQILEQKNEDVRASMRYALTIQEAILPIDAYMKRAFDYFIIFRPKDIVSGDFYWFLKKQSYTQNEIIYIAVVDCTGHGVPGAFMSIIGSRLLNEIINEGKADLPSEILELLNTGIKKTLKQKQTHNNDGMDVCLCKIERDVKKAIMVTFAGANRPLFFRQNTDTEINVVRGEKKSIGGARAVLQETRFSDTTFYFNSGDLIYLTSDGFNDQNALDGKKIGTKKFKELLNSVSDLPLVEQKFALENFFDAHRNGEEQRDDVTILGIRL